MTAQRFIGRAIAAGCLVAGAIVGAAGAVGAAPVPALPSSVDRAGPTAEAQAPAHTDAGALAAQFGLAQVGRPYAYGGTGPYAYDCSGLALSAWRTAGVYLPRTAEEQYYSGPHVPLSQLRPGDLVFWATDPADPATIYHVGISLGGDRTVQATVPGAGVEVVSLWWAEGLVPLATRPA